MYYFLITFFLFGSVLPQELLGVFYSFDTNFDQTLNRKGCGNQTGWHLIEYEKSGVRSPHEQSFMAVRAMNNSCVTSFPIHLFPDSVLELTVYVRTISKHSGITVVIFDDVNNVTLLSYKYGRSKKEYVPDWCILSIPIANETIGHIQLLGASLLSEVILIDSFDYVPDITKIKYKTQELVVSDTEDIDSDESSESSELNRLNGDLGLLMDDNDEASGDSSDEPDVSTSQEVTEEEEDDDADNDDNDDDDDDGVEEPPPVTEADSGFWNAITITLVSVGAFTVIGVTAVGAYYFGVNRTASRFHRMEQEIEEINEPARSIPRVRSLYSAPPSML